MPFHSAADIATIFDSALGSSYDCVISPPVGDDYSAKAIREKDVEKIDDFGNIGERTTVLHFITSELPGQLARGTEVTLDGTTYTIETLMQQKTYVSSYTVT